MPNQERYTKVHEIKDNMGRILWEKIQSHSQKGQWQKGFPATGLMLNSASHPEGIKVLSMLVEDVERAHRREAPMDIVKFALSQVYEWRKIALETQGRKDGDIIVGEITAEILEKELRGKLPEDYLDELFL